MQKMEYVQCGPEVNDNNHSHILKLVCAGMLS